MNKRYDLRRFVAQIFLLIALILAGLYATVRQAYAAIAPADISIALASSELAILDSNNPCIDGPSAMQIGFTVTNNGAEDLVDATISLSGLTSTNFELTDDPVRNIPLLAVGESVTVFYYVDYSGACANADPFDLTDDYTVTVAGSNLTGDATYDGELETTSNISAAAGGDIQSSLLGPGAVVGQIITQTVVYNFGGNFGSPVTLQPAGESGFADECIRLVNAVITQSNVTNINVGDENTLFYPTGDGGNGDSVTVEYQWELLCPLDEGQSATPYSAASVGNPIKYSPEPEEGVVIGEIPPVTESITIQKSADPQIIGDPLTDGPVTYSITLTNSFSSPVILRSINDSLPSCMTIDNATASGSDITAANSASIPSSGDDGSVSWVGKYLGASSNTTYKIPGNGTWTLIYTADITGCEAGSYINSATGTIGTTTVGPATAPVSVGSGTINVNKVVSGTATDDKWAFSINGSTSSAHMLGNGEATGELEVGVSTYTITETTDPDYTASYTCTTNGEASKSGSGGEVVTAVGINDDVVCTFTNTRKTGTIKLDKVWVGTADAVTLTIGTSSGGNQIDTETLTSDDGNGTTGSNTVDTGTYYVSETVENAADYDSVLACEDQDGTLEVGDGGAIAVEDNDEVVCTYTNTRKTGTIELEKVWVGTPDVVTLTIGTSTGGSQVDSETLTDDGTTAANTVDTGTYYVGEAVENAADYDSVLACEDQDGTLEIGDGGAIEVEDNDEVVCTYTNTRQTGTIELKKVWVGTADVVTLTIGTSADGSQVDSETLSADGTTAANTVDTGTYYVGETVENEITYDSSLACVNGESEVAVGDDGAVAVGDGGAVVCTYTNVRLVPKLEILKTVTTKDGTCHGDDNITIPAGTEIKYCFTVENTGNVTLTGVSISDDAITETITLPDTTLSPMEVITTSVVYSWGDDDGVFPNTATASGMAVGQTVTDTNGSIANVYIADIEVVKSVAGADQEFDSNTSADMPLIVDTDDDIYWQIVISNTGTITLDLTITDTLDSNPILLSCNEGALPSELAPSSVFTCTIGALSAEMGTHTNVINVEGCYDDPVNGKQCTKSGDTAAYTTRPELVVNKVLVDTYGGQLSADDFDLFVNGQGVTNGVSITLDAATVTISETLEAGYTQSSIGGDCAGNGEVELVNGNAYSCTITNTAVQPELTIIKTVVDPYGGAKVASDFTINISATDPTTDTIAGSETGTSVGIDVGAYTITETLVSGYDATYSAGCSGSIAVGGSATCTITNTAVQPELTITKKVVDEFGGTKVASDFTINISATNPTTDTIAGSEAGTSVGVDAGAYSITETLVSGYDATYSAGCSGSIAIGGSAACTITNTAVQPKLTIIKTVINDDGGMGEAGDFTINIDAVNPVSTTIPGAALPGIVVGIDAGAYVITETFAAGYDTTYSAGCSGTLQLGEEATCTVTNNDKMISLSVFKIVVDDVSDMPAVASDFTINVTGTNVSPVSFPGSSAGTNVEIQPGDYEVTEELDPNYNVTYSPDCSGEIELGDNNSCTITNTRRTGTLQVVKVVTGTVTSQMWDFSIEGTTSITDTLGDGGSTGSLTVATGTYTITESTDDDYVAKYVCTNNGVAEPEAIGQSTTVTVEADDEIICTVTNEYVTELSVGLNRMSVGHQSQDRFVTGVLVATATLLAITIYLYVERSNGSNRGSASE